MNQFNWQSLVRSLVAKGMTQPQIAAACGCGQSTISDIARGATTDPRTTTGFGLIRLAKERGIETPDVTGGESNEPTGESGGEVTHVAN